MGGRVIQFDCLQKWACRLACLCIVKVRSVLERFGARREEGGGRRTDEQEGEAVGGEEEEEEEEEKILWFTLISEGLPSALGYYKVLKYA